MKIVYTLVALTICYNAVAKNIASNPLEDKIEDLLRDKCYANSQDTNAYSDFETASYTFPDCVTEGMHDILPESQDVVENYCTFLNLSHFYSCLDNLSQKMIKCLNKNEVFLQDFILGTYNTSFTEICNVDGTGKTNDIISNFFNSKCFQTRLNLAEVINNCSEDLRIVKNINRRFFVIKKGDVCSDVVTMRRCVSQKIEEQCVEDYSEAVKTLMSPYVDWCRKNL